MTLLPRYHTCSLSIDMNDSTCATGPQIPELDSRNVRTPQSVERRPVNRSMTPPSYNHQLERTSLVSVINQVRGLSLQNRRDLSLVSTPQNSSSRSQARYWVTTGPPPFRSDGEGSVDRGTTPTIRMQGSGSFVVRSAPRIPESPDLSLPDDDDSNHNLPPLFSPVRNNNNNHSSLGSPLHVLLAGSPCRGTNDEQQLALPTLSTPPPFMPLVGSPNQSSYKSSSCSRALKMRRVDVCALTFF
jgi:hypothetical protein